jgi:hypothetical protein
MPAKKNLKNISAPSGNSGSADTTLVDMARSIGGTLGTAAARVEDAAGELETFTRAVRKSTLATTRKLYKRAKKSLRTRAANWKSSTRKRTSPKKRSTKSTGRSK